MGLHAALEASQRALATRLDRIYPEAKRSMAALLNVKFNARMRTTAGRAWLRRFSIDLNPHLLKRSPESLMNTLAHELAHLVDVEINGRCHNHGPVWAEIMRKLGETPTRTHDMDTSGLKRRHTRTLAQCACRTHKLTPYKLNRIHRYKCKGCGQGLKVIQVGTALFD